MTQEEKELLIKDLCARLPYKPIVQIDGCGIWNLRGVDHDDSAELRDIVIVWQGKNYPSSKISFPLINCKPYLFPLSSMTEEQEKEYNNLNCYELGCFPLMALKEILYVLIPTPRSLRIITLFVMVVHLMKPYKAFTIGV